MDKDYLKYKTDDVTINIFYSISKDKKYLTHVYFFFGDKGVYIFKSKIKEIKFEFITMKDFKETIFNSIIKDNDTWYALELPKHELELIYQ